MLITNIHLINWHLTSHSWWWKIVCMYTCIADTVGMCNICSHSGVLGTWLLGAKTKSSWYKSLNLKVKTWLRVRLRFVIRVSLQKLKVSQRNVVFVSYYWAQSMSWYSLERSKHPFTPSSSHSFWVCSKKSWEKDRDLKLIYTWQCAPTEPSMFHGGGFFSELLLGSIAVHLCLLWSTVERWPVFWEEPVSWSRQSEWFLIIHPQKRHRCIGRWHKSGSEKHSPPWGQHAPYRLQSSLQSEQQNISGRLTFKHKSVLNPKIKVSS